MKFEGFAFDPKLKYKIELGLTNRDISGAKPETKNAPLVILDALAKWKFAKNTELWIGQTKLPGNRERVISSGNLQFVDRSQVNSKFTIDRDAGLQIRHKFSDMFKGAVAISKGEGRNITVDNIGGYEYTARVDMFPFGQFTKKGDYSGSDLQREPTPKLSIGATFDYNDDSPRSRGNLGDFINNTSESGYAEADLTTVFIDMMLKYKGFSLEGEYANKSTDDPLARNADGTPTGTPADRDLYYVGKGYNLQMGYLTKKDWELAARYTHINPETLVDPDYSEYTLGFSKYIHGHKLKIQSDITYRDIDDGALNGGLNYRVQLDIHL